jgi:hypothetical protein
MRQANLARLRDDIDQRLRRPKETQALQSTSAAEAIALEA